MKPYIFHLILLVITLFPFSSQFAQITVGPKEDGAKPGKFDSEDLTLLKNTSTVFIYRENDDVELLREALNSVWDITEISFIPHTEIDKIDFSNSSVFSMGGVNTNVSMSSGSYDNTHIYLNLWMQVKNNRGKAKKKSFCRIELHPTFEDYTFLTGAKDDKALDYLYTKATLKNWQIGFLKTYLKIVNDHLKEGKELGMYDDTQNDEALQILADETLYVADYLLVDFNKFTGDESKRQEEEKLFKHYTYDYKLLSADDLNKKILQSNDPIYYLLFIKSSTFKHLTIYNSKTNEMIYTAFKPLSYNVNSSDLKSIAKAIEKSKK